MMTALCIVKSSGQGYCKSIMIEKNIRIGTCSWKYDSWEGLVCSRKKPANYLQEYSRNYTTVEIDQWFWSLFAGDHAAIFRKYRS